jgi:hypothetical protein
MSKLWWPVLLLAAVPSLFGQDELSHLVAESVILRASAAASQDPDKPDSSPRDLWTRQKNALRDWIESRLPANIAALDANFSNLEARLGAELDRAGLTEPEGTEAGTGYVSKLELSRPAEFPDALIVRAGISVECGADDSVYVYRFSDKRTRLIEAQGTEKWGISVVETLSSAPDVSGSRIFYVAWDGVSCASVWNGLGYKLFYVSPGPEPAELLFSSSHSFVLDQDVNVRLTAQDLLIELAAEAMFPGYRRTYVLHYSIGPQGVERVDPVALQPQDFVHEWLTRPWEEMQSRSGASDTFVKWHKFLHADFVSGDYEFVQPCINRAGVVQVGVDLNSIGDREIPEPLQVYFLVKDKGNHSYEMSGVSFGTNDDCPGESPAADYTEMPSLFKKK